ncbi:hypothetical protein MMC07_008668 [Pseudocyphellaria aurata]|nr:hypothetical protein [Pseudocyphellaria aurata]
MSLDPGTALAVVSLTFEVFAGCVKGFVLLSTAHNLGKDASLLRTLLNLEEYRFTQWAWKVGLTEPGAKLNPRLNQSLAADLMSQLEILLRTDKIRERYKMELIVDLSKECKTPEKPSADASALGLLGQAVSDETRGEILARAKLIQSKNSLPKRLWWAAVDKSRFEELVRDVRVLVQGLWTLLDPLQQDEVMSKIQQVLSVVIEVSKDVDGLKDLQTALKSAPDEISRENGNLAAAAGIKAVRVELQDDHVSSIVAQSVSISHSLPRKRRDILMKPLSRKLFINFVPHSGDTSTGTGVYADEPVLVEYKSVIPKLKFKLKSRIENLAVLLSTPKDPSFLTLHCLGYFEDGDRFAFIFQYPTKPTKLFTAPHPVSLLDLLRDPTMQPSVTTRIKLALNICSTLLALHTAGWLHKDLRSEKILFFPSRYPLLSAIPSDFLLSPYLTGFAFSRIDSPSEISEQPSSDPLSDIYRHPHALGDPSASFEKCMDLYSLGVIMVEIAEWRALKTLIRKKVDVTREGVDVPLSAIAEIGPWLMQEKVRSGTVSFRMGKVFGRAVEKFLVGGIPEDGGPDGEEAGKLLRTVVGDLKRCFI